MLDIEKLSVGYYKNSIILKDFSLVIHHEEIIHIRGKNGAGKSTLLKGIMGQMPYCKGKILMNGKDISKFPLHKRQQQGIGWLMQHNTIFPNLTVSENLKMAKVSMDNSKATLLQKEIKYFSSFNENIQNQYASFLSGGQKRLLSLLMILLATPELKLLILDEPSAGVDSENTSMIFDAIRLIKEKLSLSMLIVEHKDNLLKNLDVRPITIEDK